MANTKTTEEQRSFLFRCSDLTLGIGYAGRWTNIPEQSLLPTLEGRCRNSGGSGATLRAVLLRKPAIEKEARLRPQHITFGSGETDMKMRSSTSSGGFVEQPPRSRYFMKYLALLVVGASASYGQSFNGTVYDLDSGRIQVINGNINQPTNPREDSLTILRRLNAELEVSLANQRQEYELRNQTYELQRQTRLLQQIADK